MSAPKNAGAPVLYRCAACQKRVAVVDGQIIRACPHSEAGVTADLTATVYAQGGLSLRPKVAPKPSTPGKPLVCCECGAEAQEHDGVVFGTCTHFTNGTRPAT